jgi:hypothetical protein
MLHVSSSAVACEGLQQEWSIFYGEGLEVGHHDDDGLQRGSFGMGHHDDDGLQRGHLGWGTVMMMVCRGDHLRWGTVMMMMVCRGGQQLREESAGILVHFPRFCFL